MNGKKTHTVIARAIARSNLRQCWGLCRHGATATLRLRGLDTVSKNTRPARPAASRNDVLIFLLSSFLLFSCSTGTPQTTPQVIPVYSTFAAEPWLMELYDCAAQQNGVILSRVDDSNTAEILLQIGEPEFLSSFAYQIDEEEILVVTNRVSPLQNLTLEQAQALFLGLGDPSVQVWVYASDADVQKVFDQLVMEGRSVVSSAFVAVSPRQMSEALVSQPNTVGILPRGWMAGDVRDVYSAGKVPVLALTRSEPQGVIDPLIGCLQN